MIQVHLSNLLQPIDGNYLTTSYFWVTTSLILIALGVYLRIRLKRTRYLPWEESGL